MKISDIDKNFKFKAGKLKKNIYKIPHPMFKLFGLIYDEEYGFIRMPIDVASNVSDNVKYLSQHTAGGRLVFRTNSKYFKFEVKYPSLDTMYHMALTGQAGFVLNEKIKKGEKHVFTFGPEVTDIKGFVRESKKIRGNKMRTYVLHFPLYNRVRELTIELSKGAKFEEPECYKKEKPILFYGSSITQGGCASRADTSYQDFALIPLNLDYVNLGFSGNALAQDAMIDYISKFDCSIFVYDYDENAPNAEHLRKTHEKLFLKFRETHKNTPVIFLSKSNYFSKTDDKERYKIIKTTYENALNSGDKNVYFIDGRYLFPREVRHFCTVDGAHPTDLGFYFMAKKISKVIKQIIK